MKIIESGCPACGAAAAEVRTVLDDPEASVSETSDDFWLLTAALRRFVDHEGAGRLPLEVT